MRRLLIPLSFLFIGILACSLPGQATQTPIPPTPYDGGLIQPPAAALAARNDLAAVLGVAAESLTIQQINSREWNNTCLDAPNIGEVCDGQLIEGYEVVISDGKTAYTYHTDDSGTLLRRLQQVVNPSETALQSRSLLAGMLGYEPEDVRIVAEEAVRFKDSCLEIITPETACPQVPVRGTRVELEVDGILYEFHSAESPIDPLLASVGTITGGQLVIMLSRDGGVNQYCDNINITLGGKAIQYTCSGMSGETPGILDLSIQDQAKVLKWVLQFASFDVRQTRQDRVAIHISFTGIGSQDAQFTEQQEIQQFTEGLMRPVMPYPTLLPGIGPSG